jgi:hypothetical protein
VYTNVEVQYIFKVIQISNTFQMDDVEDGISMDDVYFIDGSTYALTEQAEEPPSDSEPQREQRKSCVSDILQFKVHTNVINSKVTVCLC